MKRLLFTTLVGFSMIGFTACTTGNDTEAKSMSSKKCAASGKCAGDKAKVMSKKCASSGKCGK